MRALEFSSLNVVAWKEFCLLDVQDNINHSYNINHSSENLNVVDIKCFMFYAIIKYKVKTSKLKNVEKLTGQAE